MEITTARNVTERWEWPAGILHFAAQQAGTCQGMQGRQQERVRARCSEQTVKCQRWYDWNIWEINLYVAEPDAVAYICGEKHIQLQWAECASAMNHFRAWQLSFTSHDYYIIIRLVFSADRIRLVLQCATIFDLTCDQKSTKCN